MTYSKSTDFASKDYLLVGNPSKIIRGTEIDDELVAIESEFTNGVVAKTGNAGSAKIPVGTQAQRDVSPVVGYTRFNSTSGAFEGYNGTEWGPLGSNNGPVVDVEVYVATAGQTVFPLVNGYTVGKNQLEVYVDGVNQYDGTTYSYVETDYQTVTFTTGLTVGASVKFCIWRSDTMVDGDAANMSYSPAGGASVVTTVQAKLRESVSVLDFGADALVALNAAAVDLATGGTLRIPKGSHTLTGTFTFTGQRLHLLGDGANVSTIVFNPASADVALEYNNPAAGGLYQGCIKDIGFSSSNTVTKTAINLVNVADTEVEGIGIPGSAAWGGDSIAIRSYGRQSLSVRNCRIACARPVVFSQNPIYTSLNTDHYLVEYCELTSTSATRHCIDFENGVMHTNTTLRNLALTGGKNAIHWEDTTSVGASYALAIENVRVEQGMDSAGWSVALSSVSQNLQTLSIRNMVTDVGRKGIRILNTQLITLENVMFPQTSGEFLNITMVPGGSLVMTNCFFQTGTATKTITNGKCVRKSGTTTGHTIEEWVYDTGTSAGQERSDVYHQGQPVSIASDGTTIISSNDFTGFIFVSSSEDVSAIYNLMGATNNTNEVSDPSGFFSNTKDTAAAYNIYYEAGNYILQNKRGLATTVSIYRIGTTA